ncbi:hypothetical protein PoB_000244900 [Plakobranchus ocellatus]|uniref:Uncharacterized protein n=1 Tax=Plakobranchus ocellatus TaxID=259542 RepID=A0AAV3XYM7_9GAST|nr:hypothetical protein PoB_000244900 [Plakobranchus ocellatus]
MASGRECKLTAEQARQLFRNLDDEESRSNFSDSRSRLTTEALRSLCFKGMTQNANVAPSQVWQRCPKYLFLGRKWIEVVIFSAVTSFNCGSSDLQHFIIAAGCPLNHHTITRGCKRDSRRVTQAERRQHSTWKQQCLEISVATSRAQQECERQEGGPVYASGAF